MSLINDALKRANEQKAKQVSAGEHGEAMQAVDSSGEETRLWPIALFAILLVGALWLGWSGLHSSSGSASPPVSEVNARVPEPSPSSATPPVPEIAPRPTAPAPIAQEAVPAETAKAATVAAAPRPGVGNEIVTPPPPPPPSAPATPRTTVATRTEPAPPGPVAVGNVAPASPPTAVPNTFPNLSLQGIYYRPSRPSAVINSKTVFVGDKVLQAKILAIDRHEVTVQWSNEVRVLAFQ